MKQIWSIGQRKIRQRLYKKNMDVRSHLVKSIIMHEAGIWRWKEYEAVERCQDKFIKWSLELDWNTQGRNEKTTPKNRIR